MLRNFRLTPGRLRCDMAKPLVALIAIVAFIASACAGAAPAPTAAPTTAPTEAAPPTSLPPTHTLPPTAPPPTEVALDPCAAVSQISLLQTPIPVTPGPTATAPSVSPTPRPPTPTPRPAPSEDRVGFPEGYQDNFKLMFAYDRLDNRQVRVVCGNDLAASIKPGEPFPHGSILVMETYRAKQDADGKVVPDANGHFIREALLGIFVMRKEPGFGEAYQGLRTGEWEYVAYRPDMSYLTPPENTANCAACHVGATQDKDWVFRANELFFVAGRYAAAPGLNPNAIAMNSMTFFPRALSVKAGDTLTWVNDDVVPHTMTANDGSVDSGLLMPGDRFTFTFNTAGTFEYKCSIHPEQMRATIEVTQ